ncbi:hypothetical protein A9W99_22700 [Mycobacterium sp. 1164966.3]|uniref:hypothetical protein n=1 Tax=Mycobacterium sp. 1164966.3 TaxID=1856861 RepID=UPI0007FE4B9C|nr:hypothetical protein [Mycobacterium sp. 1164966.3]OBA78502.1 hypothetical protein A9W99_22700 [Mycobacterium sp. 1164966.3]
MAQARLFESALQAELHRLGDSVVKLTTRSGSDEQQADEQLKKLKAGIDEVNRLLTSLRYRFLFAEVVDAPAEQGVNGDRSARLN